MSTSTNTPTNTSTSTTILSPKPNIINGFVSFNNIYYKVNTKTITDVTPIVKYDSSLAITMRQLITPPSTLDLTKFLNPIRDQNIDGDPVAFSCAVIAEYQSNILKSENRVVNSYLSPYYLYNLANPNATDCDKGLDIPMALDVLHKYGIPNETIFPNTTPKKCAIPFKEISEMVHKDAINNRIDSYIEIKGIDQIKTCLTNYGPCIISIGVYNNSPTFWIQNKNDTLLGTTAINIVGYDSTGFIIRNNWGPTWGKNGYGILPFYDYPYVINAYSATTMDGSLVAPNAQKITLKSGIAVAVINPTCMGSNTQFDTTGIILLSLLAAFVVGILIYYLYYKKLYRYNFNYLFKYYSPSVFAFIIFMLLLFNIIIMASINGMDVIFGLNVTTLCLYSLPVICTFFYNRKLLFNHH